MITPGEWMMWLEEACSIRQNPFDTEEDFPRAVGQKSLVDQNSVDRARQYFRRGVLPSNSGHRVRPG